MKPEIPISSAASKKYLSIVLKNISLTNIFFGFLNLKHVKGKHLYSIINLERTININAVNIKVPRNISKSINEPGPSSFSSL